MKRRNAECGKLRRPLKRNKITEGIYGSTLLYLKFLILWAFVLLADFILEFRFEFLWPFWLLLRSVYDSFKYQGLAFSVFFICIALTSDMICFFFIPVHWLFFAASTYVWVQYVWHTEKGICLPTVILWLLFVYIEAAVRLRDLRHMPFHLDLCRPFAAHCIGYPVVTLGFGFKSYIGYRMRQRKQKDVAKENEFYMQLLQQALPLEQQQPQQPQSCHSSSPEKSRGGVTSNDSATLNGAAVHSGSTTQQSSATKNNHRKSLDKGEREKCTTQIEADSKSTSEKATKFAHSNGSIHTELEFIERVGRKVQDALLAVVVKPKAAAASGGAGGGGGGGGSGSGGSGGHIHNGPVSGSNHTSSGGAPAPTANGRATPAQNAAPSGGRRGGGSVNDFDVNEVEKVDKSSKGSVASLGHSAKACAGTGTGTPGGKWGGGSQAANRNSSDSSSNSHHNHHHHHHNHNSNNNANTTSSGNSSNNNSIHHNNNSNHNNNNNNNNHNNNSSGTNNNSSSSGHNNSHSNSHNNSSNTNAQRERKNKANRESAVESHTSAAAAHNHKDEYSIRLEADVKRLKVDLQASRQTEQDLRSQITSLLSGEKSVKSELSQLQQDNDELQSKLHGLVTARQLDKQAITQLERRLQDERRIRSSCEAQLAAERKAKKAEEAAAARAVAMAQAATKQECTESCRARRRELEAEGKQLRRELKLKDERVLAAEREIQTLRQYKESHNDSEILMSALSAMQDKNAHLENSLSAETRIKLDLFSALGEAKRQLEIRETIIRAQEKEIEDLKLKIAQVLAVMPTDVGFGPVGPVTGGSGMSKLRLAGPAAPCLPCPGCTVSTLDPNATAYTPKGSLVASTEA